MTRLKRRYRKVTMTRSLKPWSPWLHMGPVEIDEALSASRW